MIQTFRSEDVPMEDRFAHWSEMTNRSLIATTLRSDHEADFRATARILTLDKVVVSKVVFPSLNTSRNWKLIRQSDPDIFQLWVSLRGKCEITQGGRVAEAAPQNLVLYNTARPFVGSTTAVSAMTVQFPRALVPVHPDALDKLTALSLPAGEGIGALLSRHLIELIRQASHYRPSDMARLSSITMDLLATLCAHHLQTENRLPAETRRQALQAQIHDFINHHLDDAGLSPDTVAAAHQISTRYLYKLFQHQGLTAADYIRRRRLERCRRDLADSRFSHVPIYAIAARWGFTDGANFSRAFRNAYGMPPKEYRNLAFRRP